MDDRIKDLTNKIFPDSTEERNQTQPAAHYATVKNRIKVIEKMINQFKTAGKSIKYSGPKLSKVIDDLVLVSFEIGERVRKELPISLYNAAAIDINTEDGRKKIFEEQEQIKKQYNLFVELLQDKILQIFSENEQLTLFANEPQAAAFQMSKIILDNFVKHERETLQPDNIARALKLQNPEMRGSNGNIEFRITLEIQNEFERQFNFIIESIRNPKYKLFYAALWKYAGDLGNRNLYGAKVNDIIRIITQNNKVSHRERKEFTEFISAWSKVDFKIITKQTKTPQGKNTKVTDEFKIIHLFELAAGEETYLIDQQNRIISGKVLNRIYGALPADPFNIGAYLPNTIFYLNGNNAKQINLINEIYRRANQKAITRKNEDGVYIPPDFSKTPISYPRLKWIELADLVKTNETNKWRANELLTNTFKMLKELNLIADYPDPLPIKDDEIINIRLPNLIEA